MFRRAPTAPATAAAAVPRRVSMTSSGNLRTGKGEESVFERSFLSVHFMNGHIRVHHRTHQLGRPVRTGIEAKCTVHGRHSSRADHAGGDRSGGRHGVGPNHETGPAAKVGHRTLGP